LTHINQSALLPYSASQLFDLVNDIQSYPEFMDGCRAVEIIEKSQDQITARLELGKAGLRYAFTTCNTLKPAESIKMALVEGPFENFAAAWTFHALDKNACKVSLNMEFEFASGLVNAALKQLFDSTSRNLVNSVCKRAGLLYGSQ
jgi:ribosome-associated toxin RatA of RatAB toxin-antitoxin module